MKRFVALTLLLGSIVCSSWADTRYYLEIPSVYPKGTMIPIQQLTNQALTRAQLGGTSMPQGHITWKPFAAVRGPDTFTDKLGAMVGGASFGASILAFNVDATGHQTLLYRMAFIKAVLTSAMRVGNQQENLMSYQFTFEKITWTWEGNKTVFTDTWTQ